MVVVVMVMIVVPPVTPRVVISCPVGARRSCVRRSNGGDRSELLSGVVVVCFDVGVLNFGLFNSSWCFEFMIDSIPCYGDSFVCML